MSATLNKQANIMTHRYPFSADLLDCLANKLSENSEKNLSKVTVFLSNANSIHPCRLNIIKSASEKGRNAILGPQITTLPLWAKQYPFEQDKQAINTRLQELILVEALLEYQQLYKNANPWALADSLLPLFEQLSENTLTIPSSLSEFENKLTDSYGLFGDSNHYMSAEASLVHQLWFAMQQQLSASNHLDRATAYRQQLNYALNSLPEGLTFYIVGCLQPTLVEKNFITSLAQRCAVHIITYNRSKKFFGLNINTKKQNSFTNSDSSNKINSIEQFFNNFFVPNNQTMQVRRSDCLDQYPNSLAIDKICIYQGKDRENEALAIQQQIRLWLHDDRQSIGFVTNNRKLARRVRALLERNNIELLDESGWNLSTTSTAAVLDQWLQCIDQDFHYLPLLDLLKSPYLFYGENREQRLTTVYKFENQIVQHENISSHIQRYLDATNKRQQRLPKDLAAQLDSIPALLIRFKNSAAPLISVLKGKHSPAHILNLLLKSLQELGIAAAFSEDDAGQQVLDELDQLVRAAAESNIKINWNEFRAWLSYKFEQRQFKPKSTQNRVRVVNLTQSHLCHFDAVVIGAAEREFLPATAGHSPFFNNSVRKQLGLPDDNEEKNIQFTYFRHLIESAVATSSYHHPHQPSLLITHTGVVNGEELQASPWLELLTTYHDYVYDKTLYSSYLQDYIDKQQQLSDAELPTTIPSLASVQLNNNLLPEHFSASSYQQIMDCPYQFYVARCLKLQPPEHIREYLQKSDYGELVHLVLQAFHSDVQNIPGPYTSPVTTATKQEALGLLKDISTTVFDRYVENNFAHRAWLNQWLGIAPAYLDWLITRQADWSIDEVEKKIANLSYAENILINARLDRIDRHDNELSIIDYKTGVISSQAKVINGEAVQLPFYALTSSCFSKQDLGHDTVSETAYLSLGSDGVKLKNLISDNTLADLQQKTGHRLETMVRQLHTGTALTAWGDEKICSYCTMEGLCRKQYRNAEVINSKQENL